MKIGKYIFVTMPKKAYNFTFGLPFTNFIWHIDGAESDSLDHTGFKRNRAKECKYLKPNTGIRYKIIGLYWKVLIIKQLN